MSASSLLITIAVVLWMDKQRMNKQYMKLVYFTRGCGAAMAVQYNRGGEVTRCHGGEVTSCNWVSINPLSRGKHQPVVAVALATSNN